MTTTATTGKPTIKGWLQSHWAVPFSIIMCVLFFIASLDVMPTYDDWYTLSSPNRDPQWQKFFLPYGSVWRPIDALMGYVSQDAHAFPLYNHIITICAHLLSTLMVWALSRRLFRRDAAVNMAAALFCVSPCMLATVFACDAINQSLSLMFGMAATLAFVTVRHKVRYVLWPLLVWLAALAKDNGIAWAVVPPLVALLTEENTTRIVARRLAYGVAMAIVYGAVRLSLPYTVIPNPEYSTFSLLKKLREVAMLFGYSFVPIDWMSLLCAQARQLWPLILSLCLTIAAYITLLPSLKSAAKDRRTWVLAAVFVVVLSPNLLITLSMMNSYAGLCFAAMLMAMFAEKSEHSEKNVLHTIVSMLLAAVLVDCHHIEEAQLTSQRGIEMAQTVDKQCRKREPIDEVFCVSVKPTERKYSSFHVLPVDAFSNGQAVLWLNNYRWPMRIEEAYVEAGEQKEALRLAHEAIDHGGYRYAWVVENDKVKVISKEK
jgi:hypothetical protein